jgi:hypothetical protein
MQSRAGFRSLHPLLLLFAAGYVGLLLLYASFTAEDAYIVYRYAENLVRGEGLVFNAGEPINALTSPLHALLCAGLYAATGASAAASKVAGAVAVGVACALALASRRYPPALQLLFAGFVALSPLVALWTVGGLETPFLLAWVTLSLLLAERALASGAARDHAAFSVALGLAFLTRYDSVVFCVPLLAAVAWTALRRRPALLPALGLPGLVLSGGWLLWSRLHYLDFLPTSFYHKRPGLEDLAVNAAYTAQFWLFSGLAVLWGGAWLQRGERPPSTRRPAALGAGVGLCALFGYGLSAATTHMMFAYRFFVPYLPVAVLLALDRVPRPERAWPRRWLLAVACVVAAQLGLALWIDRVSVNPGREGEYRRVSRRNYVGFMDALSRQADAIRKDWARRGHARPPRIHVYAAGLVPHRLPGAYVTDGGLISYRHAYDGNDLVPPLPTSADYVLTLHPYLGEVSRQLEGDPERFEPVFNLKRDFDGSEQQFQVWHNRRPTGWRLPPRIDAPANLRGARLSGKSLRGVALRGADLRGARLAGTDLRGADLRDSHLAGADLQGARLEGADLRGATGLSQAQLSAACGDDATALPPGVVLRPCLEQ